MSMAAARFFNAVRDTVSDDLRATYKVGEPRPAARGQETPMSAPFRLPDRWAASIAARPLRFSVRRQALRGICRRHACIRVDRQWRAPGRRVPSSITGRAAFWLAAADEPNALVGVGADERSYTPNLRATQVELYEGLSRKARTDGLRSRFDLAAANDLFAPLLPAGFYYKTFMWPRAAWKRLYEPVSARAPGLGRAPRKPDPGSLRAALCALRRA